MKTTTKTAAFFEAVFRNTCRDVRRHGASAADMDAMIADRERVQEVFTCGADAETDESRGWSLFESWFRRAVHRCASLGDKRLHEIVQEVWQPEVLRYPIEQQGRMIVHRLVHGGGNPDTWHFWFFCPACKTAHAFFVPQWTFNDNFDAPTFTPSRNFSKRDGAPACVLRLTDGQIEFLDGCEHDLAGKTVPLPDLPEWML